MIVNCETVTPGEPLTGWQRQGLKLVSQFQGRDVVLAFDLTGSVDFNDEGRIRLKQIIEDSLQSGDRVYVLPFASQVNPLNPEQSAFANPILFRGKSEDVDQILSRLPKEGSPLQNTDIQKAELEVYRGLARQNQCRFTANQPIKPQSAVWITDAPLLTKPGITSEVWPETPASSPFRQKDSPPSRERQQWLEALPLQENAQKIVTNNDKRYDLTVVDIEPVVQEFCTPAPGGQKICSVNAYLVNQLWLPALVLVAGALGLGFLVRYWLSLQRPWKVTVAIEGDSDSSQKFNLNPGSKKSLSLGTGLESDDWGYLQRRGNRLFHVLPSSSNAERQKDKKLNLVSVATLGETSYTQRKQKDEQEIKTLNKTTLTCTSGNGDRYKILIQVKR